MHPQQPKRTGPTDRSASTSMFFCRDCDSPTMFFEISKDFWSRVTPLDTDAGATMDGRHVLHGQLLVYRYYLESL